MKTCTNCGREEQNDDLKFCPDCGTPFSKEHHCPSCKYVIPAGSVLKFCPNCGAKIEAKKSDEFVLVEGGNYFNGSENEKVESFYISKIPVTQKLWKSVKGELPRGCSIKGNYKPVVGVSWNEAIEFCNALSKKENLEPVYSVGGSTILNQIFTSYSWNNIKTDYFANGYRLPSSLEWAFACKGGNDSNDYAYPGSDNLNEVSWVPQVIDDSNPVKVFEELHDVALKEPNELGLYDMLGNCTEWLGDTWGESGKRYFIGGSVFEGNDFNPNKTVGIAGDSYIENSIGFGGLRLARSVISEDDSSKDLKELFIDGEAYWNAGNQSKGYQYIKRAAVKGCIEAQKWMRNHGYGA